ncbi:pre-mRNA-splicing factor cwc26 [Aspergillus brasiliensis]|nr:pre-mRNA-splicing factor cwc26 [Aspergillus brasiliensis]
MKRAELRQAEEEKHGKETQAKEALMADVQRQGREKPKYQLEKAKTVPVAWTVEDEGVDDESRVRERGPGKSATGKPSDKKALQADRYGIRPATDGTGLTGVTSEERLGSFGPMSGTGMNDLSIVT